MREEKEIIETLVGCYRYAPLIHDDYQRFGMENFIAGLEYCLDSNSVINAQILSQAHDLGLRVKMVKVK